MGLPTEPLSICEKDEREAEEYRYKGTSLGMIEEILAGVLWKGTPWMGKHCIPPFSKLRICGESGMKARQLWIRRLWSPASAYVKVK